MGVYFDEQAFMVDAEKLFTKVLNDACNGAIEKMRRNLAGISKAGKPEWREEVAHALKSKREDAAVWVFSALVGMVDAQSDKYLMIKAKLLEDGSVAMGQIWHIQDMPGLNDDITGLNLSSNASYKLPDKFITQPQNWFKDTLQMIDDEFTERVSAAFDQLGITQYIRQ